jgi:hypothetical protein
MSSEFVKEGEYQQLKEVTPNMSALLLYLRRENGGPTREVKSYHSEMHGRELHEMSDGLTYALNDEGQWSVIFNP